MTTDRELAAIIDEYEAAFHSLYYQTEVVGHVKPKTPKQAEAKAAAMDLASRRMDRAKARLLAALSEETITDDGPRVMRGIVVRNGIGYLVKYMGTKPDFVVRYTKLDILDDDNLKGDADASDA